MKHRNITGVERCTLLLLIFQIRSLRCCMPHWPQHSFTAHTNLLMQIQTQCSKANDTKNISLCIQKLFFSCTSLNTHHIENSFKQHLEIRFEQICTVGTISFFFRKCMLIRASSEVEVTMARYKPKLHSPDTFKCRTLLQFPPT
jgi:hypothetical protein